MLQINSDDIKHELSRGVTHLFEGGVDWPGNICGLLLACGWVGKDKGDKKELDLFNFISCEGSG